MEPVDLLIEARWLIPIEPAATVLEQHAIAIHHGRIVDLCPAAVARTRYAPRERLERPHHVLLPGLVNAHTHAAMTLLRGVADDVPFDVWFGRLIWPLEQRWVSTEFVRDGAELAVAEMLLAGITCFGDMYFYPEETARVAAELQMRACIGAPVADAASPWARDADDYLSKGLELRDAYRDHPLITTAFAPHSPYLVSDASFERIRTYVDELDAAVMMHVHESAWEIAGSIERHGMRPLPRLERLGMLSPQLQAVHFVHANEADIELAARTGLGVVHCPESNLKLGNGICPVTALQQAGIEVALGTDGAASNNDLDLFGEMRMAALLAKGVGGNPTALDAHRALRMATLGGARVLGLDADTGSLNAGKWADLCCVDLDAPATLPVHSPASQLVYAASRNQVSDVWVAGRQLVASGQLTRMDLDHLRHRSETWRERITASLNLAA